MNHETELLVMCLLMLFIFVFSMNSKNVEALRLIVHDEDESQFNQDFLLADEDMNPLADQTARIVTLNEVKKTTNNFKELNYADLKSIKFFYADNGTIIADIVLNKDTNYRFAEGTAYGMAININAFPNASNPVLSDADYIYKYVYNKGTWNKVLAIRHSGGEEKSFSPNKIGSNNLNETENFVRMDFNTAKIGKPDSFQVQFFAWTNANLPNNHSYSLIDVTRWIEVPEPKIFLTLDRTIKVYPNEPKTLSVTLNSTSSLSKNIDLQFCQHRDCELSSTTLSPPTNLDHVSVTLNTKNIIDPLHLNFTAFISPNDPFTAWSQSNKEQKVWNVDVVVGDHWSEKWESLIKIPPHIILLLVSIVTFIGGIFIDKKGLSLRFNKFLKNRRKKNELDKHRPPSK